MQRVWVVGNSGSGKTRLARSLAASLGAKHLELDAIYHQADWQPMAAEQFRTRVAHEVSAGSWVVDGNYSVVSDLVVARADTVVWIDLPRSTVMRQLGVRTLHRTVLRRELWNGNREPLLGWLSRDPEKSIMLWAWHNHAVYAERYEHLAGRTDASQPSVIRLRSRRDVDRFLSSLTPIAPG